jgi:hypothetical protein
MAWLIENDGIDFLTKGAESMGKQRLLEQKGSDMVTTVNYHRYAKRSSAELIAEGAIS